MAKVVCLAKAYVHTYVGEVLIDTNLVEIHGFSMKNLEFQKLKVNDFSYYKCNKLVNVQIPVEWFFEHGTTNIPQH